MSHPLNQSIRAMASTRLVIGMLHGPIRHHPRLSYSGVVRASLSTFMRGEKHILCTTSLTARRRRRDGLKVHGLFGLGVPELIVIAGVTALIFGPKKLPEIGRSLGKTVKSFQQAAKEFETEVKKEGGPSTSDLPKSTSSEVIAEADEKI